MAICSRAKARPISGEREESEGERAASRLVGAGLVVQYLHLDVSRPEQWENLVTQIEASAGGIDVLVDECRDLSRRGFHRRNARAAQVDHRREPARGLLRNRTRSPGHVRTAIGLDRQHLIQPCGRGMGWRIRVRSNQGRDPRDHAQRGGYVRPPVVRVNAIVPGAIETAMTPDLEDPKVAEMISWTPLRRVGQPRGGLRSGDLPRLRRVVVHHRSGATCRRRLPGAVTTRRG